MNQPFSELLKFISAFAPTAKPIFVFVSSEMFRLPATVGPKRNVCAFATEKQPNASNDNKIFFMCFLLIIISRTVCSVTCIFRCKSTIVFIYTQLFLMRNGKNAVRSGDICVLRGNAGYLRSTAYAAMHAVVSSSERASASQMPLSPSIFGSSMKLGTRNTAPRSSANIIAGRTRSTLWK